MKRSKTHILALFPYFANFSKKSAKNTAIGGLKKR